jgi:hypothetical protein
MAGLALAIVFASQPASKEETQEKESSSRNVPEAAPTLVLVSRQVLYHLCHVPALVLASNQP